MIEAYTIGITLALEDGVSEGIAAIRRDLGQLDAAVADSAARLLMLRKLADEIGFAIPTGPAPQNTALFAPASYRPPPVPAALAPPETAVPGAPAGPSESAAPQAPLPPLPSQTPPAPLLPATQAPEARISAQFTPPIVAAAPIEEPQVPRAVAHPIAPSGPWPPTAPPQAEPKSPVAPIPVPLAPQPPAPASSGILSASRPAGTAPVTTAPSVQSVNAVTTVAGPKIQPAPSAPIVILGPIVPAWQRQAPEPLLQSVPRRPDSATPDFAALARSIVAGEKASPLVLPQQAARPAAPAPSIELQMPHTVAALDETPPPRPSPMLRVSPSAPAVSRPEPHQSDIRSAASAPLRRVASSPNAQESQRQFAAPSATAQRVALDHRLEMGQSNTRRPAADAGPPDTRQADSPTHADIHLDGAALGRWVTRHLERQVIRPPSGATGFDPRMTPSWSGAPTGS